MRLAERREEVVGKQSVVRGPPRGDVDSRDRGCVVQLGWSYQADHRFRTYRVRRSGEAMEDRPELPRRSRRAISLIAAALVSIIVATFLYLRAATPTAPSAELPPPPPTLSGYSATYDFVTASTGWALVTREGRYWIFRTVDGARHWRMQDTGEASYGESAVNFVDPTHGEIAFFGGMLRVNQTSDAGLHWRPLAVPGDGFALTFTDANNGWLLTWNPAAQRLQLLSTRDGGMTWIERVWPAGAYWIGRGGVAGPPLQARGQGRHATRRRQRSSPGPRAAGWLLDPVAAGRPAGRPSA